MTASSFYFDFSRYFSWQVAQEEEDRRSSSPHPQEEEVWAWTSCSKHQGNKVFWKLSLPIAVRCHRSSPSKKRTCLVVLKEWSLSPRNWTGERMAWSHSMTGIWVWTLVSDSCILQKWGVGIKVYAMWTIILVDGWSTVVGYVTDIDCF